MLNSGKQLTTHLSVISVGVAFVIFLFIFYFPLHKPWCASTAGISPFPLPLNNKILSTIHKKHSVPKPTVSFYTVQISSAINLWEKLYLKLFLEIDFTICLFFYCGSDFWNVSFLLCPLPTLLLVVCKFLCRFFYFL